MGDLSDKFSRWEFECHGENCCDHSAPVHPDLIKGLQALRDAVKRPLTIISGFRCNKHNKDEDGKPKSYHRLGMAADIVCEGLTMWGLSQFAKKIPQFNKGGIGIANTFIHVDVRGYKARWQY